MRIRWYGQSTVLLRGEQAVFINPFGDMSGSAAARGMRFDYPPIEGPTVALLEAPCRASAVERRTAR